MPVEWVMPSLPVRATEPVGVPDPEVGATVPETVAVWPWTKLEGLTLSVATVDLNVTVFQYLMRLATSTEPSPVAWS